MRDATARCEGTSAAGGRRTGSTSVEALVEVGLAGDVVQHPFIDPQRASGQGIAGADLDQLEMPQRRGGKERAPLRAGQDRERESECRVGRGRIGLGRRQIRREAGVHFDAGAQQQHVALERREAETRGHRLDGRRHRHCLRGFGKGAGRRLRIGRAGAGAGVGGVRATPFEVAPHACERGREIATVGFPPRLGGGDRGQRRRDVHDRTTVGAVNPPGAAPGFGGGTKVDGLSTPSIWMRTR